MPYCPICEKCLYTNGRKGSDKKYQLGTNLRRHKASVLSGVRGDTKFGGVGIISTKCGHLFHKNCLNEYITNYRTKGDCYGTTYNVLCPLCGANLSNGKSLRIDLEAHFGILEEFFQDLCKLKYMNKELKRTVELEWADIAELEKKMWQTKAEYEHVRTIKRGNEQRCADMEERISKAVADAHTCYKYREIEKQLVDENVNLEVVARMMETIINTRIRTTTYNSASSSTMTTSDDNDEESRTHQKEKKIEEVVEKEQQNAHQYKANGCQQDKCNEQQMIVGKSYVDTSDSNDQEYNINNNKQSLSSGSHCTARQQVDISVQISVHSEWSLNSGGSGEVEHRRNQCAQKQLCSRSGSLLSTDSNLSIYSVVAEQLDRVLSKQNEKESHNDEEEEEEEGRLEPIKEELNEVEQPYNRLQLSLPPLPQSASGQSCRRPQTYVKKLSILPCFSLTKTVISPPQMFSSTKSKQLLPIPMSYQVPTTTAVAKETNQDHSMELSFPPLPPIPTPRIMTKAAKVETRIKCHKPKYEAMLSNSNHTTLEKGQLEINTAPETTVSNFPLYRSSSNEFVELVLPPPPLTDSEQKLLDLIVPPPPPMSAPRQAVQKQKAQDQDGGSMMSSKCDTPESTRRFLDSLLTKSYDGKKLEAAPLPRCTPPTNPTTMHVQRKREDYSSINSIAPNHNHQGITAQDIGINYESEDELLKAVMTTANSSFDNNGPAISGGGDMLQLNNLHQIQQSEEDRLVQYMISRQESPTKTETSHMPSSFCSCLAAERFIKNHPSANLQQSSVQSVRVGVEQADDHQDECSSSRENTNSPTDLSSNHNNNYWSFENRMTVNTPVVIEHKNNQHFMVSADNHSYMRSPKSTHYFSPEPSLTTILPGSCTENTLTRNLINNNNCWLTESNVSLGQNNSNFLTTRRNFP